MGDLKEEIAKKASTRDKETLNHSYQGQKQEILFVE